VEDAETYVSMATSKGRCSEVFVHDEEGVTKKRELEGRGAVKSNGKQEKSSYQAAAAAQHR
jgi:hypothetical protein